MNIRFLTNDPLPQGKERQQWENLITEVVSTLANEIGLPVDYMHEFVLADKENYPQAVKLFPEVRKFTNNDSHAKFAKTILHEAENKETRASIIFRKELMEDVLGAIKEQKEKWNYNQLLYKYLLCHELGHCLDLKNRYQPSQEPALDPEKFSIQQMYTFFSSVLLEEFAACVLSGPAMTSGVFHSEINNTSETAKQRLNELESMKENFTGKPQQLFELAVSASSIFWIILIQYAKLIGNKISNKSITPFKLKVEDKQSVRSLLLLNEMGKQLGQLWSKYHDWKPDDYRFLLDIWLALALENSFKFVETPQGDGVYWN